MMKTESGRSMVEMLGVLAIIGVLSVGGIAGYTTAMKKYRVNEAAQELSMAAILCGTQGTAEDGKFITGVTCTNAAKPNSGNGSMTALTVSADVDCTSLITAVSSMGTLASGCGSFTAAS